VLAVSVGWRIIKFSAVDDPRRDDVIFVIAGDRRGVCGEIPRAGDAGLSAAGAHQYE